MAIESDLILKAQQLETAIQETAFELLRREGSYDRAQGLIVIASDINLIGSRLSELLVQPDGTTTSLSREPVRATPSRRKTTSKYPCLFVAGNRVVKIGKGKQKNAKEYRHEATRASFDQLARWIESQAVAGSREWLAKDADLELKDAVPPYQTYLLISALSAAGVLRQVKRGRYAFEASSGGPADWWDRLEALPSMEAEGR